MGEVRCLSAGRGAARSRCWVHGVAPDLLCSSLGERAPGSRPRLRGQLKGSPNGHGRRLPWHQGSRVAACWGTGPRLLLVPMCPRQRQPGIYPAQELCRRGDPSPLPARGGPPGTSLHPHTEDLGSLQTLDVILAEGLQPTQLLLAPSCSSLPLHGIIPGLTGAARGSALLHSPRGRQPAASTGLGLW